MKQILVTLVVTSALVFLVQIAQSAEPQTVGLIENVRVDPGGLIFRAKLDTGADHCSINAQNVHRFKRQGERLVRFQIVNDEGRSVTIERRLVRVAKIKRPTGERHKRPVVMLAVCLGSLYREVQVNLVDRTQFRNKLILGRSFMKDALLVNPAVKHTIEPKCPPKPSDSPVKE